MHMATCRCDKILAMKAQQSGNSRVTRRRDGNDPSALVRWKRKRISGLPSIAVRRAFLQPRSSNPRDANSPENQRLRARVELLRVRYWPIATKCLAFSAKVEW